LTTTLQGLAGDERLGTECDQEKNKGRNEAKRREPGFETTPLRFRKEWGAKKEGLKSKVL